MHYVVWDREAFEVLDDAVTGRSKDFYEKGAFSNHLGALSSTALIAVLGIYLPQPAGIPITGCAQLDLGIEVVEEKFLDVILGALGHDSSLTQKGKVFHFLITRTYQDLNRKSDKFHSWQAIDYSYFSFP
jgi:hypothetical protein